MLNKKNTKTQPLHKKPGDFYPVCRNNWKWGQKIYIGAIKYVVFEEAKTLDENADIFIVFRERQKRYKNVKNPWGLLSGVWKRSFLAPFLLNTTVKHVLFERAQILYEKSDIFIVLRERQKRYKHATNPWGLLSGV